MYIKHGTPDNPNSNHGCLTSTLTFRGLQDAQSPYGISQGTLQTDDFIFVLLNFCIESSDSTAQLFVVLENEVI